MSVILIPVAILAALGLLAAVLLVVADHFLGVPTDETVTKVRALLPGANCGACGYTGCDGYAEAVAKEGAPCNKCIPGGPDTAAQLAACMGTDAGTFVRQEAFVRCQGNCDRVETKLNYEGIPSCAGAAQFFAGTSACAYGCLGYGDCAAVCPENAITVVNGLATVNPLRCIGCGKCTAACPKGILELRPAQGNATVLCRNADKGAVARKTCSTACIGCMLCQKKCSVGAVKVERNLAYIDPAVCTGCGACAEACPQKCIQLLD